MNKENFWKRSFLKAKFFKDFSVSEISYSFQKLKGHAWREQTNNPMMDRDALSSFANCSAARSELDGLSNLVYEKLADENYHVIRKITVDLKYGERPPLKAEFLCEGDMINMEYMASWKSVIEHGGRLFS